MIKFLAGVLTGAFLIAVLATAQDTSQTWRPRIEGQSLSSARPGFQLSNVTYVTLPAEARSSIGAEVTWTLAQQRSLEQILMLLQERQEKIDTEIEDAIRARDERHYSLVRRVNGMVSIIWEAIRYLYVTA